MDTSTTNPNIDVSNNTQSLNELAQSADPASLDLNVSNDPTLPHGENSGNIELGDQYVEKSIEPSTPESSGSDKKDTIIDKSVTVEPPSQAGSINLSVVKEGWAWKKGQNIQNWKKRFFELTGDALNYFEDKDKQKKKGFASIKDLKEVGSYDHKKKPFCIGLKFDSRLLLVSFDSEGLKDEWLVEFKKIQPQELGKETKLKKSSMGKFIDKINKMSTTKKKDDKKVKSQETGNVQTQESITPQENITVEPPPENSTVVMPPPESSTIVQPPVENTTIVMPPPESSTIVQPPVENTTIVIPPPESSTNVQPPIENTTIVIPPPESSTIVQPPVESTTIFQTPHDISTNPEEIHESTENVPPQQTDVDVLPQNKSNPTSKEEQLLPTVDTSDGNITKVESESKPHTGPESIIISDDSQPSGEIQEVLPTPIQEPESISSILDDIKDIITPFESDSGEEPSKMTQTEG